MEGAIKREEAGIIARDLRECLRQLQKGNIFSCLVAFEDILKRMLATTMLPADEKDLNQAINSFQKELAASKIFRDVYGPVTFRDNDIATALDFMKQLIEIKEEETRALLNVEAKTETGIKATGPDQVHTIKTLIEKGDHAAAQELLADKEDLAARLAEEYNDAGIEHRRAGRLEEAIREFRKALVVLPRDEGLFYNLARAYIGKEDWQEAAVTIGSGLQINPDFTEGVKLLKYIREHTIESV